MKKDFESIRKSKNDYNNNLQQVKLIIYLLRWQLSTPILSAVIYFTIDLWGNIASTILANLIGGLIFYKVDKLIFKKK